MSKQWGHGFYTGKKDGTLEERKHEIEFDRAKTHAEVRQDVQHLLNTIAVEVGNNENPFQDDGIFKMLNTVKNLFHFVALKEYSYMQQMEKLKFDKQN